ncbi:hypothetical protein ACLD02_03830 [Alloalcanivorax sp. C16-2]|uniref:hypothetical protein n=1 Tax=Alloalcanivorax sp. C16-2 TaxID=3390052 RepID=UPI001A4D7D5D|nr:hypothetical protein [Alloalcanivorax marinus]
MRSLNHRFATVLFVLQVLLAAFAVGLAVHGQLARAGPADDAGSAKVSVLWRTC